MIAFIENNKVAMDTDLRWFAGRDDEHLAFDVQARAAAVKGQWRTAQDFSRRSVDLASHTYSVTVYPGIYDPPVAIATGYRFRTEQADVASLSWLGQYVDQPSSDYDYMFNTCDLTAMY